MKFLNNFLNKHPIDTIKYEMLQVCIQKNNKIYPEINKKNFFYKYFFINIKKK